MDAKLIYIASSRMVNLVKWSDWVYCGIDNDFQAGVIEKEINQHLQSSPLYFVISRTESGKTDARSIIELLKNKLAENQIIIWDNSFKKVMAFDRIGVMRKGFAVENELPGS
jgi:hypothetical protein